MRIGLTEKQLHVARRLEGILDTLSPQSKLPPERQLAEELRVSRALVRDELGRLEAEGKVWRHVGQGTFLGKKPDQEPGRIVFSAAHTSPAEVLEVRMLLEPQIARVAALRANEMQIGELKTLANKCKTAASSATWELWDSQFHKGLCEVAANGLLISIYDGVNAIRRTSSWTTLRTAVLTADRRNYYAAQHQEIIDAISIRDGAAACEAMTRHIRQVSTDLTHQEMITHPSKLESSP